MTNNRKITVQELGGYLSKGELFEVNEDGAPNRHYAKFEILNEYGVHARPAGLIAGVSGRYDSNINLCKINDEGSVNVMNAKSIMGLMSSQMGQGSEGVLIAEGSDSKECLEELVLFFKSGFGES